jgi:hypothetical protein
MMKSVPVLIVASLMLIPIGCGAPKEAAPIIPTAITGLVRDQSGAEIASVKVELRNPSDSAFLQSTVTNAAGEFVLANMPKAAYRLTFTLNGFQTATRDVSANTDKFSRVDVLMAVSPEVVR